MALNPMVSDVGERSIHLIFEAEIVKPKRGSGWMMKDEESSITYKAKYDEERKCVTRGYHISITQKQKNER